MKNPIVKAFAAVFGVFSAGKEQLNFISPLPAGLRQVAVFFWLVFFRHFQKLGLSDLELAALVGDFLDESGTYIISPQEESAYAVLEGDFVSTIVKAGEKAEQEQGSLSPQQLLSLLLGVRQVLPLALQCRVPFTAEAYQDTMAEVYAAYSEQFNTLSFDGGATEDDLHAKAVRFPFGVVIFVQGTAFLRPEGAFPNQQVTFLPPGKFQVNSYLDFLDDPTGDDLCIFTEKCTGRDLGLDRHLSRIHLRRKNGVVVQVEGARTRPLGCLQMGHLKHNIGPSLTPEEFEVLQDFLS